MDVMSTSGAQRGMSAPPAVPVNPSCFGSIDHSAERVRSLAGRIESIVARLCGNYPTAESTIVNGKPSPEGLLGEANDRARQIDADVDRMHAELDRLGKSLP